MDLPTSREIGLETLLRQRDAQVADLTDELTHLRQYLSVQPKYSTTDPISLPPALVSLLLPHINDRQTNATGSSNTVTTALTQRVKVLQEENDELYDMLKMGETGKLKDEVRALRRVVQKLEGALRESHQVIASLSDELEKSHATIVAANRPSYNSQSPAPRSVHMPSHVSSTNGSTKPPPTAPRAHKKPRLSDGQTSPSRSRASLPPPPHAKEQRSQSNLTHRNESHERSPRVSIDRKPPHGKMDVDEDQRMKARSPTWSRENEHRDADKDRERDRPRERDRGRDRVKDKDVHDRGRDRDRDRDRTSRRTGAYGGGGVGGGGGGRRAQRNSNANSYLGGDRTLAERMGL